MKRVLILVVAMVAALAAVPSQAGEDSPFGEDTTAVGLTDSETPNIDVAVELSQATFEDGAAQTVLIGREDLFADSLSSGVAQDDGPLLLVPTDGPVPGSVRDEIERLGATQAIVFGGEAAVSAAVVEELEDLGLTVQRVSGPTRIETAVATAQAVAPQATTAVVARAGGVEGNPTSAFADTLAAGALAAINGWPVLLTQTDVLTASTRDYLQGAGITEVVVVGGPAAVSEAVVGEIEALGITVRRLSGADRAATAVAIAGELGFPTAADTDEVIVVDGFSDNAWAAGFAAAARAAALGAPIVLGNVDSLPPATGDYLTEGPDRITCALSAQVCDAARVEIGLDPVIPVETPVGTILYSSSTDSAGQVRAATFEGEEVGFVYGCPDSPCDEMDWSQDGQYMVLHELGAAVSFFQMADGALTRFNQSETDQVQDVIDASDSPDDPIYFYFKNSTRCFNSFDNSHSGGCGGGVGFVDRDITTFQSLNVHAGVDSEESTALYLGSNGELVLFTRFDGDGFRGPDPAQVQPRAGAALIGAALSDAGTGDIAIVDAVAGVGLLRIAPWPDGEVIEVDGLDVVSDPYWLPEDSAVAVIADNDGTNQLVSVDPATGETTVLVADAGPDIAERIESDASGTLIAWRSGNEIRVWNRNDDSVATITPPEGTTITGGPAFRPSP